MTICFSNLDGLLSDPLIQAVMRADRVDPESLERDLSGVGRRLASRRERAFDLSGARVRFAGETRPAPAVRAIRCGCESHMCV